MEGQFRNNNKVALHGWYMIQGFHLIVLVEHTYSQKQVDETDCDQYISVFYLFCFFSPF